MRRMVKEELLKFDGTPLFPERRAYTVNYELSQIEAALYEAVTNYVQTEMGKADQLEGARKGSVGFALTALQRRLASSPEAIFQSLKRRRERLENRLQELKLGIKGRQPIAETLPDVPEDEDDLSAEEQETLEEDLIDEATAALGLPTEPNSPRHRPLSPFIRPGSNQLTLEAPRAHQAPSTSIARAGLSCRPRHQRSIEIPRPCG